LFTLLFVVALLGLLEDPKRRSLFGCAILFAVWANLHGGFVYGLVLIGLYLTGSLGELVWNTDRKLWAARASQYLAMLLIAGVMTLLNPYGIDLHRHIIEFFNQPFLRDNTAEFVSPDFHQPDGRVFLLVLLLVFATLAVLRLRPTLPRLLVTLVGIAFALISIRNIPLFGLTALPLVAFHANATWRGLPDPGGVRGRFDRTAAGTTTIAWVVPVVLLLGALGLARGRVGPLQLIRNEFDPTIFPIAAVAKARSAGLEGHLFTSLAWGGYLGYAWPERKIFIDGGTDFFGEDLFREYIQIRRLSPGWRRLLDQRNITWVLLERETALAHELARDPGWTVWYCDSLAVLLRHSPSRAPSADSERELDGRCASRSAHPVRNRQ
jgi:hypothetical protein